MGSIKWPYTIHCRRSECSSGSSFFVQPRDNMRRARSVGVSFFEVVIISGCCCRRNLIPQLVNVPARAVSQDPESPLVFRSVGNVHPPAFECNVQSNLQCWVKLASPLTEGRVPFSTESKTDSCQLNSRSDTQTFSEYTHKPRSFPYPSRRQSEFREGLGKVRNLATSITAAIVVIGLFSAG